MTTKPKIIQSALAAISGELKKMREERTSTAAEIGKLQAEIKRLQDMPVSRADFGLLLQEHIAAQAQRTDAALLHDLQDVKKTFDGQSIEYNQYNKRGMAEMEVHRFGDFPDWIFSYNLLANPAGGVLASGQLKARELQSLLCWLLPEVIHSKIMAVINEQIGAEWGNDTLPSVAERREQIADMQAEIASLQARLAELDAALAELGSSFHHPAAD
ncbi:hypothetical protein [Paralysiella testudinis]|uniref:Uncharacterized protein n=1 Tax=Paralysiella testudinis TaxID=2809020 RepID=A0A892ZKY1_9NEIS|nr:hypothetical protein [Paralysiella testudinis]QRQ82346.1 hypothetical protein JQU52_02755 [Paralysiella testudinis]